MAVSSICLYTEHFASILASQVTSKLLLMPLDHSSGGSSASSEAFERQDRFLNLWILSPSIHYSFTNGTASSTIGNQHAMKIFFQTPSGSEAELLAEKEDVEEVFLPHESIIEIGRELIGSTLRLPQSARKFGLWNVGLLERFST